MDHYNIDKLWYPPELSDDKDTILILAGDLWISTRWIEHAGVSWISAVAPRFKTVLVVLGNHDYWPFNNKLTIKNGADKCNALLQDFGIDNVKVLDKDTHIEGDYIFVGATLWTDMNKRDPMKMFHMSSYMTYDSKIAVETYEGGITKLNSERWVAIHSVHRQYIKTIVEANPTKKIFVITHHIPLTIREVCDPRYINDLGNAYYYSDLSELILDNPNITHWVSGHTHFTYDVMFGVCRMLNRSVGYQGEHKEQEGLVLHDVIDL